MPLAHPYIGADIAKDWIDVFDPKTARAELADMMARLGCVARDIRSVLAHVRAHKPLRTAAARLQTMPGIGPILIAGLPELGRVGRRKIAIIATARKLATILNAYEKRL